jgi:hypothetical protein
LLGDLVGEWVGVLVGEWVGVLVGDLVGEWVGVLLGEWVGVLLGAGVASPALLPGIMQERHARSAHTQIPRHVHVWSDEPTG